MAQNNAARTLTKVLGSALKASRAHSRHKLLNPSETFRVGLEGPLPYETVGDEFQIRGWAVSLDEHPVSAHAVINKRLRLPLALNQHRFDVAQVFGLTSSETCVGFSLNIAWDALDTSHGSAEIGLEFVHNGETLAIGPLTVYHASSHATPKFLFALQRPTSNEIVAGDIEISGWAFSLDRQPLKGRIVLNRTIELPLMLDQTRPDVSATFDLPLDHPPTGFFHQLPWSLLGQDATQAEVSIELAHGRDLVVYGPMRVFHVNAPLLKHQRGSYKEVWEGAASDRSSAMATVAGTVDEEDFLQSGESTAKTISTALAIARQDTVLEIGCGIGRVGSFIAPICTKWIGADISSNMLSYARKSLSAFPNVELVELRHSDLRAFADSSVDKLYCSTVFMHLDEWDRFRYVREAFRVLRAGGRCYFDNVNLAGEIGWSIFEDIARIDSAQRSPAVTKPSTGEELETYLSRAGFVDLKIRREEHYLSITGTKPE